MKKEPAANPEEFNNWLESVLKYRNNRVRKFFFAKLKQSPNASIKQNLEWIYSDLIYVCKQVKTILREIYTYGSDIKSNYEISRVRQFKRLAYVIFALGFSPEQYRKYLLFKSDRWRMVDIFIYEDFEQQRMLRDNLFPEEYALLRNKFIFYKHCLEYSLQTPPILAAYINEKEVTNGADNFWPGDEDLFLKELNGIHGKGVNKFQFNGTHYVDIHEKRYSAKELMAHFSIEAQNDKDFIIQPALKNHNRWNGFTSGGLATCRIVTARTLKDDIMPLAASMRMPTGLAITDNFSGGGIASPIDLYTGKLDTAISKVPRRGSFEFDVHPDTGQQLTGTGLPNWNNLKEFAFKVHQTFNTFFIGWDIAFTPNGFVVVEGNSCWGVNLVESPQNQSLLTTQYPALFDGWMQQYKSFN